MNALFVENKSNDEGWVIHRLNMVNTYSCIEGANIGPTIDCGITEEGLYVQ